MMSQSIKVSYPKSHGNAPKRTSSVESRPSAPKRSSVSRSSSRIIRSPKGGTVYAKR